MHFIIEIIIGALAGWLAGTVVRGGGFGFLGNVVLGIVGSLVSGWLFPQLGFTLGGGFVGQILFAAIGAIVVLVVIGLIKRL